MRVLLILGIIAASAAAQAPSYAAQTSPSVSPTHTSVPTAAPSPSTTPSPSIAASPSTVRHPIGKRDWWVSLSRPEKLKVVEGAIDGLLNGWWRAFSDYDTEVIVISVKVVPNTKGSALSAVDKLLWNASEKEKRSAPTFSKRLGSYIDGIDHFYQTFPHTANVSVGEVLQCLSDKPWKSCADIAAMFS